MLNVTHRSLSRESKATTTTTTPTNSVQCEFYRTIRIYLSMCCRIFEIQPECLNWMEKEFDIRCFFFFYHLSTTLYIYIKLVRMHILDVRISLKMIRQTVSCVVVVSCGVCCRCCWHISWYAYIARARLYRMCFTLVSHTFSRFLTRVQFNLICFISLAGDGFVRFSFSFGVASLIPYVAYGVHVRECAFEKRSVSLLYEQSRSHAHIQTKWTTIHTYVSSFTLLPLTCERARAHTHMPIGK